MKDLAPIFKSVGLLAGTVRYDGYGAAECCCKHHCEVTQSAEPDNASSGAGTDTGAGEG